MEDFFLAGLIYGLAATAYWLLLDPIAKIFGDFVAYFWFLFGLLIVHWVLKLLEPFGNYSLAFIGHFPNSLWFLPTWIFIALSLGLPERLKKR
jgi:hypothetical protein